MSPPYFPHKTRLIRVAAGCLTENPPLIPRQPWERTGSGGKRGSINWRHQARECDYSGLVFKAVTGLRSIPSPRVALCLSWVTAIQRGRLWLSSTELPAWNWASLQASAAAHRALSKFPCFHFFGGNFYLVANVKPGLHWPRQWYVKSPLACILL